MKKLLLVASVVMGIFCLSGACAAARAGLPDASILKEGDIIFQKSRSAQSRSLRMATGSVYTHCGILLPHNKELQIFEASNVVRWTPLAEWIKRGIDGHYVIMRLKKSTPLTPAAAEAMRKGCGQYAGKAYDTLFQWSDEKMYCSELVWKLYKRYAGIELGPLHSFYDYHLDHKAVRALIRARYGRELPAGEKVIAPSDLMDCGLLEVVAKN